MSAKKYHVYGIGNAIMDLQLRSGEKDLEQLGVEKGGMQLVDLERQQRILLHFENASINKASGGSAANTVIALSQLGARTAYGCVVGDDQFGKDYLNEMKELGVHLHSAPLAGRTTGTSIILITPDAERTMNTHLGASMEFAGQHVSEECIAQSDWLYVEGYLFASANGQDAVKAAMRFAKQYGVKVAITFSDGFIIDVFGDPLREAVQEATLVFANRNEALKFTGTDDEDAAFQRLTSLVPSAVMTLGEKGARVWMGGGETKIAPFPVTAVDDTGAGDMFAGGFLYGVSRGLSPADAGKLGCFLASRVVAQLGPRIHGELQALATGAGLKIE